MTPKEKEIIKALNKVGVDTRYISLYNNNIYINNLKFSKILKKKGRKVSNRLPGKKSLPFNIISENLHKSITNCKKSDKTPRYIIHTR